MYKQEDIKIFWLQNWTGEALESWVVFLVRLFLLSCQRHLFLKHALPQFPCAYSYSQITTILTASLAGGSDQDSWWCAGKHLCGMQTRWPLSVSAQRIF